MTSLTIKTFLDPTLNSQKIGLMWLPQVFLLILELRPQ